MLTMLVSCRGHCVVCKRFEDWRVLDSMTVCWQRYRTKAWFFQCPRDFTILKGTPQRRYSSVPQILRLWPLSGSRLREADTSFSWSKNAFLVSGLCPFACLCARGGPSGSGVFTARWFWRLCLGLEILSCFDQ